jgi:pyridoxamine 5'-phosphate oxidase-like protein
MSSVTHDQLLRFLQAQRLGVVASISPAGDPQSAVVGIAVTDMMEIVFDTLSTTRKCENLRRLPKVSIVTGWDQDITVQCDGVADEPSGDELERIKACYFGVYPDGVERQRWEGITYFRVRAVWIRYSDFSSGGAIDEFVFSPNASR